MDDALRHWKTNGLDLSNILSPAIQPADFTGTYAIHCQNHGLDKSLDNKLIQLAQPALLGGEKVFEQLDIVNTNRVVGAMLSNKIIREVGSKMLPDDTIHYKFNGSAGQSLGCWLAKGITLEVEGDANDFIGKGLSGGRVIVYPPKDSQFLAEKNIIVGNVALYGATSGEAFFSGIAAERFCVRNSGAVAIVEGVGDHACEYMTGGSVVILGETGRNFAAGMSGGIAYVWDPEGKFESLCNLDSVELETIELGTEEGYVRNLIQRHVTYTDSRIGKQILDTWDDSFSCFVKVMPVEYKKVLQEMEQQSKSA